MKKRIIHLSKKGSKIFDQQISTWIKKQNIYKNKNKNNLAQYEILKNRFFLLIINSINLFYF